MTPSTLALGLLLLPGCQNPAAGTFVGNPTMSARLAEAPELPVLDGLLVALEVLLGDCDGVGDVPLGARTLTFDGPFSEQDLQIPTGTHCGVFFVMDGFTIRFDEGDAEPTTVIADDFDLWIETRFESRDDSRHAVQFGDAAWLEAVAAAAEPGENLVDGSNPALDEAFFGGLERGSGVDPAGDAPTETTLPEDVPGKLDLEDWPESPLGTPTSWDGCGPTTNYDLAVPIPPAAMQAAGFVTTEVGWCEANVLFADDLTPLSAQQVDHRDGSLYPISYNGWSQGCGALHCGEVLAANGEVLGRPCTVLALCEAGTAAVTGFTW